MEASREVEIVRDGYGIAHCYAPDERGAFFAQGWAHADDRLWQMEYDRRRARGRWAEVAGARGVANDVFFRRLDLVGSVQRDLDAVAPETVEMLAAYAAGVNARIDAGGLGREFDIAGVEPRPWEPLDSLLVHRVRHALMGSARHKLWRSVVRAVAGDEVAREMVAAYGDNIACVPPGAPAPSAAAIGTGDVEGGSNNWALAGSRTASGLPLLAGDPHRELEAPNVYVQVHVACPDWDVLGIGMPGVPGFPHFAHNARVAWSITHAMADDQDLYEVDVDAHEVTRREMIEVRDGEPVEVDVVHTPRGPVIGDGLALSWTATVDTNTGFDTLAPMLRAGSVDELFETMRSWVEPVNSLLAADVDGHIGYLTRGRVPRRRRIDGVWWPVPAGDASFAWDGWVPFEDMPRCVDPEGGFLFSANNTIAASADAPYIGIDAAPSWRARRIVDALAATTHAKVGDMEALQRDLISLPARQLLAAVTWAPLEGWDGSMDASSRAAAAYSVLRRELMAIAFGRWGLEDAATRPRNRLLPGIVPESAMWRFAAHHLVTDEGAIAEAIARAEDAWNGETWGELHQAAQRHGLADATLDPDPMPVNGDPDTVMVGGYTPTAGLQAKTGSVARYVWDVADWDNSGWVVPLGAAGDVAAPHGVDQRDAWREGRLLPAPYSRAAVEAAATSRSTLVLPRLDRS